MKKADVKTGQIVKINLEGHKYHGVVARVGPINVINTHAQLDIENEMCRWFVFDVLELPTSEEEKEFYEAEKNRYDTIDVLPAEEARKKAEAIAGLKEDSPQEKEESEEGELPTEGIKRPKGQLGIGLRPANPISKKK